MKQLVAAILLAASLVLPGTAHAWRGHGGGYGHGHHHGSDVAWGVLGGLIGGVVLDRVLFPPAVAYEPYYPRYRAPRVYAPVPVYAPPYPAYGYEVRSYRDEYPRRPYGCRESRYSRDY